MEELMEKVENLKNILDENDIVKEIKNLNLEIAKDEELLNNISLYQQYPDSKLKEKIINNELFRKYKHQETELNFIILKINQELKKIKTKGSGCSENN